MPPKKGVKQEKDMGGNGNGKRKMPALPEGFIQQSVDGQRTWVQLNEEWFEENGHDPDHPFIIFGELTNRFRRSERQQSGRQGGSPYYYTIRLLPADKKIDWDGTVPNCARGSGDEREIVVAKVGDEIAIDEKSALECLKELAEDSAHRFSVYLMVLGKEDIGGSQSFWRIQVGKKLIGNRAGGEASGGKESGIPF